MGACFLTQVAMQNKSNGVTLALLHFSIFIAGFTGVFGRLIELSAPLLSLYRTLMAAVLMSAVMLCLKKSLRLPRSLALRSMGVGALLFIHWVFFYASIKLSNVSIGVICLSAMGFFTALLEPLCLKRRFRFTELILSFIALLGLLAIFHFDLRYRLGIAVGLLSSLMASLFTILNKTVSDKGAPLTLLTFEMWGAALTGLFLVPLWAHAAGVSMVTGRHPDYVYLFLLASVCTVGLYFLQLKVLTGVSAFTVNLSYNLEPVYSILIAMVLFAEYTSLGWSFVGGLTLIALSVLLQNVSVLHERGALPSLRKKAADKEKSA